DAAEPAVGDSHADVVLDTHAPQVLVGSREMLTQTFVLISAFGSRQTLVVEQVLVHPMHPQVQRVGHRHAVDGVVVNDLLPGERGEVGEIGIILDRVSAEVRRQIYTFRLEKSRKLWN